VRALLLAAGLLVLAGCAAVKPAGDANGVKVAVDTLRADISAQLNGKVDALSQHLDQKVGAIGLQSQNTGWFSGGAWSVVIAGLGAWVGLLGLAWLTIKSYFSHWTSAQKTL